MVKNELIAYTYSNGKVTVSKNSSVLEGTEAKYRVEAACYMNERGIVLKLKLPASLSTSAHRVLATLVSSSGSVYYAGFVSGETEITVPSPCLWWPVGLGIQNLYKLTVSVYSGTDLSESFEYKIPLRTLSFNEEGRVIVNGVPVFVIGAAYENSDEVEGRDIDSLKTLVSSLAEANINAVALKMGESMPLDFCELCDKYGLMVLPLDTEGFVYAGDGTYAFTPTDKDGNCSNILSPETLATYKDSEKAVKLISDTADEFSYPYGMPNLSYASSLNLGRVLSGKIAEARISKITPAGILLHSAGEARALVSSSLFDPRGNKRPAHYLVKRAASPLSLVPVLSANSLTLYLSNQRHGRFVGELTVKLNDSKNFTVYSATVPLIAEPFTAASVYEYDFSEYLEGRVGDVYLYCSLSEGQSTVYECTQLFTKHREFAFEKPNFTYAVNGSYPDFYLTLSSDVFCRSVTVLFDGDKACIEDNCFDITSPSPLRFDIITKENISKEKLLGSLKIQSVYDIGK